LASATVGTPYAFTFTASGAPTFSLTSGALPPGLTLSAAGLLSGTPTASGTFTGTVTAANGVPPDATQDFSITVAGTGTNQPPVLEPIPDVLVDFNRTVSITAQATDPDSPPETLIFSLDSGAPANVHIDPTTGVITIG